MPKQCDTISGTFRYLEQVRKRNSLPTLVTETFHCIVYYGSVRENANEITDRGSMNYVTLYSVKRKKKSSNGSEGNGNDDLAYHSLSSHQ